MNLIQKFAYKINDIFLSFEINNKDRNNAADTKWQAMLANLDDAQRAIKEKEKLQDLKCAQAITKADHAKNQAIARTGNVAAGILVHDHVTNLISAFNKRFYWLSHIKNGTKFTVDCGHGLIALVEKGNNGLFNTTFLFATDRKVSLYKTLLQETKDLIKKYGL